MSEQSEHCSKSNLIQRDNEKRDCALVQKARHLMEEKKKQLPWWKRMWIK